MIATENRIFTGEDEMFAYLIERGFEVLDCTDEEVIVERSSEVLSMVGTVRFKKLDDGRVTLI
jgi:hypothetical protein